MVTLALTERTAVAAQPLALLLLVHGTTGSYAIAGGVSAANGLCAGISAPVQGRRMDKAGQTRVLVRCALGNALALSALAVIALNHAPLLLLLAFAALAGALRPALSPAMQVLWPGLAGSQDRARTAFALEATMVELSYVCGPLLAAAISAATIPAVAVIGAATLTVLATIGFAASRPSRAWRPALAQSHSPAGALTSPGIRTIVLAALPTGVALGAIEVGLPAFAGHHGSSDLGGLLLAVVAAGSTTGGLCYGARRSNGSLSRWWLSLGALLAIGLAPLALASNFPVMVVACVAAGAGFAPLMSASWGLIARLAPSGDATNANAWYSTAIVGGTALGAAAAGVAIQHAGIETALLAPCLAAGIGAGIGVARRKTLLSAAAPPVEQHRPAAGHPAAPGAPTAAHAPMMALRWEALPDLIPPLRLIPVRRSAAAAPSDVMTSVAGRALTLRSATARSGASPETMRHPLPAQASVKSELTV